MHRSCLPLLALLAALVLPSTLLPATAHAQSADEAHARRLFDAGVELVRDGRPDAAVPLFRESLARVERPTTAFNLAIALRDAGEPRSAMSMLIALLGGDYGALEPAQRQAVERQEALLAQQLAALEVELRATTAATLYLDGEALGALEPSARQTAWLDPGPHRVRAAVEGGASVEEHVELRAGERTRLILRIEERAAPAPVAAQAEGDDGVWVGLGIGGALLVLVAGAVVTGVLLSDMSAPSGGTVDPVYGRTETLVRF